MDDKDRQLLGFLRKGIPVSARPFEEAGRKIGVAGADVLLRLTRLKERGVIGSVTAVLERRSLGYQSVAVAMELPEEEVDFEIAALRVNRHPGVFRSCRRLHSFNFWFTLMLPAGESFEEHLNHLSETAGGVKTLSFPVSKRFRAGIPESADAQRPFQIFSAEETEVLRLLQEDFPLTDEPFSRLAKTSGVDEVFFLETVKKFEKQGVLRRLAVLFPAEEELPAPQDMAVWQVPEEKQDAAAVCISRVPGVTYCVKRKAHPEFPYGLAAFFAPGADEKEKTVLDLEGEIGKWPWVNLPVVAVLKNQRPKYFPRELEKWGRKNQLASANL